MVENDEENMEALTYAVISQYSPPDVDVLEDSYHTLWVCSYTGDQNLKVIPMSTIISVISMQPLPRKEGDAENLWFVVEKSGLDDMDLTGYGELEPI
jgi:hypothetical protein